MYMSVEANRQPARVGTVHRNRRPFKAAGPAADWSPIAQVVLLSPLHRTNQFPLPPRRPAAQTAVIASAIR